MFEKYLRKWVGFKGLSLILTWIGVYINVIPFDYPAVILISSLLGLKVSEDIANLHYPQRND